MSTSTQLKDNENCQGATCETVESPRSQRSIKLRPRVDILEHTDHFLMTVDLPGVAKEDLDVTLEKDQLSIQGVAKFDLPEGYELVSGNRYDRRYERVFRISDEIDRDGIEIESKNGVAVFRLPKSVQAKKTKLTVK